MPTIERTPAEGVARCNTLGAQHATPARRPQHAAQQRAQRSPAPDVKALAKQALERIEGRNGARNTERNTAVAGRCIGNEGAQHLAGHERTARIAWRDGARSIPSRLQAMALAFNAARRGLIRQCSRAAAMRGCIANAGRR